MNRPGEPHKCPVCSTPVTRRDFYGERGTYYDCSLCGHFGLTRSAEATLPGLLTDARKAAILSYGISRTPQPQSRDTKLFDPAACKKIVETGVLPTPQEQADSLILWLGTNLSGPGDRVHLQFSIHGAMLGIRSADGLLFVVNSLSELGLLKAHSIVSTSAVVTLTFPGWERFDQLRRGAPSGRKAFMAMPYGQPLLDRLVNEHFRTAVAQTGFELRRLDDEQPAGLIDDRLRVEIQSAHFLIADLTHDNRGAYWEAGYAEGLGKSVIYTCQHAKFAEVSHFDTNHHLTVLWDENAIDAAMERLKATIRATIPEATRE